MPDGAFLIGSVDGHDVSCGGVCRFDTEARSLGYRRVRLETGVHQDEALRLYRSSGFGEIPRYGPYVDDELSVCFEKLL